MKKEKFGFIVFIFTVGILGISLFLDPIKIYNTGSFVTLTFIIISLFISAVIFIKSLNKDKIVFDFTPLIFLLSIIVIIAINVFNYRDSSGFILFQNQNHLLLLISICVSCIGFYFTVRTSGEIKGVIDNVLRLIFIVNLVPFVFLMLNALDIVKTPSLLSSSSLVLNNFLSVAFITILQSPLLYSLVKKQSSMQRYTVFALMGTSIFGVAFFSNVNIILTLGCAIFLILFISKKLSRFTTFYLVVFGVVLASGLLLPNIQFVSDIRAKVNSDIKMSIPNSFETLLGSIVKGNVIWGTPNLTTGDSFLLNQGANYAEEVPATPTRSFSSFFEFAEDFGIIMVFVILSLIIKIYSSSLELSRKLENKDNFFTLDLDTIFVVLISTFIFGFINFQLLILGILGILYTNKVIKSKISEKIYNQEIERLKGLGISISAVIIIGIIAYTAITNLIADYKFSQGVNNIEQNSGGLQDNVNLINEAKTLSPQNYYFNQELANIYLSIFLIAQERISESQNAKLIEENQKLLLLTVDESNKAINKSSYSYQSWISRYNLLSSLGTFTDANEAKLVATQNLEKLAPNNGSNLLLIAGFYVSSDASKARDYLKKANETNPNVDRITLEYAKSLVFNKQLDLAKPLLEKLKSENEASKNSIYEESTTLLGK